MKKHPFANESVEKTFESYPEIQRKALLELRQLIYKVADEEGIELEESLKWGQPSYKAKKGTAVRISIFEKNTDRVALFVSCQTTLVSQYKLMYDNILEFSGTRAIVLDPNNELPIDALSHAIHLAITYFVK